MNGTETKTKMIQTLLVFAIALAALTSRRAVVAQDLPGVQTNTTPAPTRERQVPLLNPDTEMRMKIKGAFTFAAAVDLIDFHPVSELAAPDIQATINVVRNADMGAANMEANIVDLQHYDHPISDHTGTKEVAQDVKNMGFRIVGRANNHSTDMGTDVMFSTNGWLDQAGIVYAGSGRNLDEAREAHFVQTPKGRVGMVAMYSSFNGAGSQGATYRFGNTSGMPGVNVLHLTVSHIVTQSDIDELRKMRDEAYQHRLEVTNPVPPISPNEPKDRIDFWGTTYKAGDVPGGMSYTMNPDDEHLILRSIRAGKYNSDFMIALIHSHEDTNLLQMYSFSEQPSDFLIKLAHEAVDNGADVFIGTGVHVLRSIEIYKGKPIFYGMSGFVNQITQGATPLTYYMSNKLDPYHTDTIGADLAWKQWSEGWLRQEDEESAVAECKYSDGKLTEVIIHPIDLGYNLPFADKGSPRAAHGEVAQRILQRLQKISQPFGTTISIEGEVGVIHVN